MANAINWFEIPASNFDRAVTFYSQVLETELAPNEMMGTKMAFFPCKEGDVSGAVCAGEMHKPSADGTVVYLNGGEDLSVPLDRVEGAGGKIMTPKTKISDEIGYFAIFQDSEGNRVAFHSPK